MLEAQQRTIELDPLAPTLNVTGDWGGVQARRMVGELIDTERRLNAVELSRLT